MLSGRLGEMCSPYELSPAKTICMTLRHALEGLLTCILWLASQSAAEKNLRNWAFICC